MAKNGSTTTPTDATPRITPPTVTTPPGEILRIFVNQVGDPLATQVIIDMRLYRLPRLNPPEEIANQIQSAIEAKLIATTEFQNLARTKRTLEPLEAEQLDCAANLAKKEELLPKVIGRGDDPTELEHEIENLRKKTQVLENRIKILQDLVRHARQECVIVARTIITEVFRGLLEEADEQHAAAFSALCENKTLKTFLESHDRRREIASIDEGVMLERLLPRTAPVPRTAPPAEWTQQ